jgi:hypothetical protein
MKPLRFFLGPVVIAILLVAAPQAFADGEGDGHHIPFNQDPGGGGGIGSGSCLNAQRGICLGQYANYHGVECPVQWCEPDPASGSACTTDTRPECYIGTDRNGEDSYVEVNVCTLCPRGNL